MLDKAKLNSAIRTLRDYCASQQECSTCIFYDCENIKCKITDISPTCWSELKPIYTALDYQAAEFCKALGYSMINIGPTHTVCAISGNKGSTFSLPGYLFKDLSYLCCVDIDDILATKLKEAATND